MAIDGAPPRVGRLWTYLVASASILKGFNWDYFKTLVTLQYPELEPIEDVRDYFDEFYAFLKESHRSELSSVPALGNYLRHFQVLFLAMVTWNALELSHRAQLFLRGLPPQVELEVSRRLASRYPLYMSGHLWPIEVIVHITKEVIEDWVGHLPPHLASTKPSSSLKPPKEPPHHSHSPLNSYRPDAPVEYSWSRSRRCSKGSSSSKSPSHPPFEADPRTSKNTPRPPKLASSSSSPLQATNAGLRHPAPPGWSASCEQASDSPSNSLRSSREVQQSHAHRVRARYPQPFETRGTKCGLEGMLSVSFVVEKGMFEPTAESARRLDFWVLARGPGSFIDQVPPPPSSSKSMQPSSSPQVDHETTLEHPSSSRSFCFEDDTSPLVLGYILYLDAFWLINITET
ncbi:hypothetical protein EDD15DRAFT_2439324 [Pisolithus albus]|nr:hypothetical protein EDD15DRAFT_2439324 [Pisolithus albus]